MRKIILSFICAFGLALPVLPSHAQQTAPQHWDLRNKVAKPDLQGLARLRFVTTTDFPPFNFIDATGRISGYHLDLARAICATLGRAEACQIEARPWGELGSAIEKGEAEAVIAGLTPTAETRQTYLFTKSFFKLPARFIAKSGTQFDPREQGRKKIGVLKDSAHQALLTQQFPQFEAVALDNQVLLFKAIKDDDVAAVFGDAMRLSFWLGSEDAESCCSFAGSAYAAPDYLGTGLSIAVAKEQPQLQAAFDYALSELARDGTLDELYRRYFPVGFF